MLDILVVDEDSSTRMGLAYALGDAGHRVVEAADGATALLFASERAFDLIIADVRLPKVDGNTLARHMRESSPSKEESDWDAPALEPGSERMRLPR